MTEPSGIFSSWKVSPTVPLTPLPHPPTLSVSLCADDPQRQANAIGRSSKTVREFLEKNWKEDQTTEEGIKLAVKSLLEVVQTGAKNIDLAVMEGFGKVRVSPPPLTPMECWNDGLMWWYVEFDGGGDYGRCSGD